MRTIDLIVLGILKREALSAYDIQKQVTSRNISQWVKISIPSIYKKVIQLEKQGYLKGTTAKTSKMPEKVIYSLTKKGRREFEKLMLGIATRPINLHLDLNAVILNLDNLSPADQKTCLSILEANIKSTKTKLTKINETQQELPTLSTTEKAVMHQQYLLIETIERWLTEVKQTF